MTSWSGPFLSAPRFFSRSGRLCRDFLSLTAAAIFLFLVQACDKPIPQAPCNDPLGCVELAPGEAIQLGMLQALSGKVRPLGLEQVRGIELALDSIGNRLLDRPVVLQTEDTGCSAEGGTNAALKILANPKTVAIIGTTCSTAAAEVSKIASEAGLVMISGNNSAPFLTSIGGDFAPFWQEGYFRTAGNEKNAGRAAARFAAETLGLKTAALINDGDIYTTGLTRGFGHAFEELGGHVVLAATVNKGDEDMSPVINAVNYSDADILFFPLFQPEGNRVLLQAKRTPGLEDLILMSDGALIEASFIEAVGQDAVGMYFVGPHMPGTEESRRLETAYREKYTADPSVHYYLNAFDAARLLFHAIEKAAVRNTDKTVTIGRHRLRQELYAIQGFDGATGRLSCDRFGDCGIPRFNILMLDDPAKGVPGLTANVVFEYTP